MSTTGTSWPTTPGTYAGDKNAAETRFQEAVSTLGELGSYSCTTRLETWLELLGTKVLVVFMGLYLGVVFLLASAAVLALQQLTQAADNAPRYRILAQLGAPENMRARSVETAVNKVIAEVGRVDAASSSAVAALLLLVVYGGYFLATCRASRRLARGG